MQFFQPTKRHVRFASLALLIAFVAGFTMKMTVGEPYPAILLPGFPMPENRDQRPRKQASSAKPVASYAPSHINVYFSEHSARVSLEDLFPSIPDSHHTAVMYRNFSPPAVWFTKASDKRDPPRWRRTLEESLLPGLRLRRAKPYKNSSATAENTRWLRTRLRELYPDSTPIEAVIVWRATTLDRGGSSQTRATLTVDLQGKKP